MSARFRGSSALARTLVLPGLIALLSGAGLVIALVGDGAIDLLACAGIAAPVAAVGWACVQRRT